MNKKYQQGAVLVVTLLFLLIITLLGLSIFETSFLQNRMQKNYHDNRIAFQYAENALQLAKNQINEDISKGQLITSHWSYQFQPWKEKYCQNKDCFLIIATGKQNQAVATLKNIYVIESVPQVDGSKKIRRYSLVWSELTR